MEQKRNFFEYAAQTLAIFGFTVIVMNIFCIVIGDGAEAYSTMFSLGNKGISTTTTFQFLGVSALTVFFRMIFFTDMLIKKMPIAARTVGLLTAILLSITVFVAAFGWFPVDDWRCWLMFLLCFGISFILSLTVTILKEKAENRQMEKALEKIKEKERK